MAKKSDEGFSLIELIVVLAGLGILSSLAIPTHQISRLPNWQTNHFSIVQQQVAFKDSEEKAAIASHRRSIKTSSYERLETTGCNFQTQKRLITAEYAANSNITRGQTRMPDLRLRSPGRRSQNSPLTQAAKHRAAKSWAGKNVTGGRKELMDYNKEILGKDSLHRKIQRLASKRW